MNGRVYDPTIGRFLSADTIIPYMYNTQSFNRYSYVRNNPLKYIDPSGHWGFSSFTRVFKKIVKNTHTLFKKTDVGARILYSKPVKRFFIKYKWARTVGTMVSAYFGGPAGAAAFSAYLTEIQGGSYSDMLKSAVITYASAYVAKGIGDAYGHDSSFLVENGGGTGYASVTTGYTNAGMKAVAHGLSRVAFAKAQGQKTSSAFWSGFVASGFSVGNEGYGEAAGRTAIMAIVGGTTSEISGGKFANGAVTAAFVHLYNAENFGQKVMNKLTQGYYEVKGAYNNLTSTPIGRIAVSATTAAVGGGVSGYKFCGSVCVVPGVILGTGGGLIKGSIKEATNYYEIRDKLIRGSQ